MAEAQRGLVAVLGIAQFHSERIRHQIATNPILVGFWQHVVSYL